MGPRYSDIGAAQALVRQGREVARHRLAGHGRGVLRRRRREGREGGRDPVQELPDQAPGDRRQLGRPPARAGGRSGRRRDPQLHPRHGAGLHEGGDRPGPRRQGQVGLVDADRQHVHGSAVPAVRREDVHQLGVRPARCFAGPGHPADAADPEEVHEDRLRRRSPRWASWPGKFSTQALLNVKGAVTAKSYNAAVRALKNVKTDMLCKPWYVGNNLPYHIPNNTDITVTYKGGKVVANEEVLQHRARRPGARQDARVGEEVQTAIPGK